MARREPVRRLVGAASASGDGPGVGPAAGSLSSATKPHGSAGRSEHALASREANPGQEAEADELAERLRAALAQLPADQAEVFCLSCLDKLSYREIGERLRLTTNAVGVLLHRARQRLRELLAPVDAGVDQRRLRVGQVEDRRDEQLDELLDRATEALRQAPVPPGPPPEAVARVLEAVREADVDPAYHSRKDQKMKRIAKIAVAATVLVAIGILVSWMVIGGGSGNIAFARVAEALDSLRSATYDVTSEAKGENGQPPATATGKGFFLAPSHQRIEISVDIGYDPAVKAAAEAARRMHVPTAQRPRPRAGRSRGHGEGHRADAQDEQSGHDRRRPNGQSHHAHAQHEDRRRDGHEEDEGGYEEVGQGQASARSVRDGAAACPRGEQRHGRQGREARQERDRRTRGSRLSDPMPTGWT